MKLLPYTNIYIHIDLSNIQALIFHFMENVYGCYFLQHVMVTLYFVYAIAFPIRFSNSKFTTTTTTNYVILCIFRYIFETCILPSKFSIYIITTANIRYTHNLNKVTFFFILHFSAFFFIGSLTRIMSHKSHSQIL